MAREYKLRGAPRSTRVDYARELNPQQLEAVQAPPGPALVIAGAGSGKTRTLTYRVAYLLENGIQAGNILLLTFTNKAAREMMDRVTGLLGSEAAGLWGGTFHSIGNRMIRRHAVEAGLQPGFSIIDREDQEELLGAIVRVLGFDTKGGRFPKGEVLGDIISFATNTGRAIGEVLAEKYPYFVSEEDAITDAARRYAARKQEANLLDFDDLLSVPLKLLRENGDIAAFYRRQFQFILVDEYQDTNHLQAEFVDGLAAQHRSVMVVGDDAQSIYSWRGADLRNILGFTERYPGAAVYRIETNYRSVPEVLDLANAAIAANAEQFKKTLRPARAACGTLPALAALEDANWQAMFVAQRVLELMDGGVSADEIAVLYRAHFHSMEIQMEFTRHGIPFRITSGLRFFEQAHIKDVAAHVKFAVNPRDEVAFKRVVRLLPGIGERGAETLWAEVRRKVDGDAGFLEMLAGAKVGAKSRSAWEQLAYTMEEIAPGRKPLPPAEMLHAVIEAGYDDYLKGNYANYDQRKDDLNTLVNYARQFEDAAAFLDQLALVSGVEQSDELAARKEESERVTLSSVHQAKGLEWKAVFVISLADGMFPNARSAQTDAGLEEERRLFYVAVTRAKDELYLSYPMVRLSGGYGDMMQAPSRFLGEIPQRLVEAWKVGR